MQVLLFLLAFFPATKRIEVVTSTDYSKGSCKKAKFLLTNSMFPGKFNVISKVYINMKLKSKI